MLNKNKVLKTCFQKCVEKRKHCAYSAMLSSK